MTDSIDMSSLEEGLDQLNDEPRKYKRIKRKRSDDESKTHKKSKIDETSDDDSFIEDDYLKDRKDQLLLDIISDKLKERFPDLSRKELNKHIAKAIEHAKDDIDDIIHHKEDVESLKKEEIINLNRLKKILGDRKPTIQKILRANIPESDRLKALELFFVLENLMEDTMEYNHLSNKINRILDIEKEIRSDDELKTIEEREQNILKKIGNSDRALRMKILNLDASEDIISRIYEMYLDYERLPSSSDERSNLEQKLLWAVNLPYRRHKLPEIQMKDKSPLEIDRYCSEIYKKLDGKLYGMKQIKERLIQIINNRIYKPTTKSMIALKGVPGVGKTAIAKALAESLDLPFERISLGGMKDSSEFTGTTNVWVGSTPSILIRILKRMKYANGIILFDELDKLEIKEIQYALLHITDYIQNSEFQDMYLHEFPHDLSSIWFMFAMNDDSFLDSALKDRLDIIKVEKYKHSDIINIILLFLFPRALEDVGIDKNLCSITKSACDSLIYVLQNQMKDNGLRAIDKELHQIASKINMLRTQLYSLDKSIKLSYSLKNFKGFPYTVTSDDIHILHSDTEIDSVHMSIYG